MLENVLVSSLVHGAYCSAAEDGNLVYEYVATKLRDGVVVTLCFEGAEDITSAFLNAAIGRLYDGEFSDEHIRNHLSVSGMDRDDIYVLKRVVDRAKEYFRDPENFRSGVDEVLNDK